MALDLRWKSFTSLRRIRDRPESAVDELCWSPIIEDDAASRSFASFGFQMTTVFSSPKFRVVFFLGNQVDVARIKPVRIASLKWILNRAKRKGKSNATRVAHESNVDSGMEGGAGGGVGPPVRRSLRDKRTRAATDDEWMKPNEAVLGEERRLGQAAAIAMQTTWGLVDSFRSIRSISIIAAKWKRMAEIPMSLVDRWMAPTLLAAYCRFSSLFFLQCLTLY